MRPRANTISHVDNSTVGILASNASIPRRDGSGLNLNSLSGMGGLPGVGGYHPKGMSSAAGHHGNPHVLPKLETKHHGLDVGTSLRTAPPIGGFGNDMNLDHLWYGNGSSTINPAQLHFSGSPQVGAFEDIQSPFHQGFPSSHNMMEGDSAFGWVNTFESQLSFDTYNEHAIDNSSPSADSTGSPGGMSEVMLDGSNNSVNTSGAWQNGMTSQAPFAPAYSMNLPGLPFPDQYPTGKLSPKSSNYQLNHADQYFQSPQPLSSHTPFSILPGMENHYFHPPMMAESETPSNSAASISSSNRQSSVTSVSTDSITDATRQALLNSLSQPSPYGQLKTSQPQVSSLLSPDALAGPRTMTSVPLPSTYDLQRYVAAYIQYFHPHLPFLHIPSLSFDSPAFTSNIRPSSGQFGYGQSSIAGGGGSLILAMAAIGALYEYDFQASKELFEMAKKMIQLFLDERRKAEVSVALTGDHGAAETAVQNTPLWLVQAMLLNVIYGQNCGDKVLAGIASTHCAALINLAKTADLANPASEPSNGHKSFQRMEEDDLQMACNGIGSTQWNGAGYDGYLDAQNEWYQWKLNEERKRTLYAVFVLSSLCVSAYNHAPALMNSEIGLDLPCDENLWAADSAETWRGMGGAVIDQQRALPFASALSSLLTASQRSQSNGRHMSQSFDPLDLNFDSLPKSEIQPSTFGCIVLINALHNYIWETRQRHAGRPWTTQETEAMHAHIEPALQAWLVAWKSNPEHSSERPNPFGASSLSADCLPYLDLAYVRLYVNLGQSKEAFFKRDFDAMAEELARGVELVQHADYSLGSTAGSHSSSNTTGSSPETDDAQVKVAKETPAGTTTSSGQCSRRERHLRKAGLIAASALERADRLGNTFADHSNRDLPLQSALCAFDCAQMLAEWVSIVQQRVGRYLGTLGKDEIDFTQVPAIMLLEEDDIKLLDKIHNIITSAEMKLADSENMGMTPMTAANSPSMQDCGYGSKMLLVHARMFERVVVWPSK
ncbi:hypothetical protein MMC21_002798 [Puttea exsequens]|nr:hypothetical protein [Puttea exsequens]